MYTRFLEPLLIQLLDEFRIIYLAGPRQAGKTTLVRSIADKLNMIYFSLDNQSVLASVLNSPHDFIHGLRGQKIILDEFQYAPSLVSVIKEVSDNLPPGITGQFILTGSADIFHSAKVQEALPGHIARLELYPLSIGELGNNPQNIIDYLINDSFPTQKTPFIPREILAQSILNGGYPEIQKKSARAKHLWFKSYIEGRLFKDFESLYASRGDYHSKLKSLIPYLAGLTGNLLKYHSVSNDLGLDDKVVKSYIEILELMFIVKRVPAYLKNQPKSLAVTLPKLQFIDTGLACSLLGLRHETQLLASQYYGGLLENYLLMELMKNATWSEETVSLYHFRDNQKNEVDIVLATPNGQVIGIEIKASTQVKLSDFKGLVKLAHFAGQHFKRGILFYTGQDVLPFTVDGLTFYALPISLLMREII
jgi:predicted AAA+ superfamily ATPase